MCSWRFCFSSWSPSLSVLGSRHFVGPLRAGRGHQACRVYRTDHPGQARNVAPGVLGPQQAGQSGPNLSAKSLSLQSRRVEMAENSGPTRPPPDPPDLSQATSPVHSLNQDAFFLKQTLHCVPPGSPCPKELQDSPYLHSCCPSPTSIWASLVSLCKMLNKRSFSSRPFQAGPPLKAVVHGNSAGSWVLPRGPSSVAHVPKSPG